MLYHWAIESVYRALASCTPYTAWTHFQQLQRNQYRPLEELEALRWTRLQELLAYAQEQIPFYRDLWKEAGVDPRRFTRLDDIVHLPVITKADLVRAQQEDTLGLSRRNDFQMTHTSGTTGPRLYLPFTREDLQLKYAAYLREFYATGWRLGVRSAAMHYCGHPEFGGRYMGEKDRDNFVWTRHLAFRGAHRRILLTPYAEPTYRDDPIFRRWYHTLRRHRPYLLESMDFNLLALYRHIRLHDLPPLHIPRMIVLATLAPPLKRRLEDFFQTEIFNRFGPHEIEGVGYSCSEHNGLHMSVDCVVTEFLDDAHQPVEDGQTGHLVLTDLYSRVMPLIRYKIGDMAHAIPSPCTCGRTFPLMGDIQGRTRDVFTDAQNRPVPAARVAALLQADPDLDLFQVNQDSAGRVEVHIPRPVKGDYDAVTERVKNSLVKLLGDGVDIDIIQDGELKLEINGRFCFARRT